MLAAALLLNALVQAGGAGVSPDAGAPPVSVPHVEAQASPPANPLRLTAGAEVQIEMAESIGSATAHVGDKFALRLAEPIVVQDKIVVAAGAVGQGEVIDAGRAGMNGRQGKLIVSARYLELAGRHVRIHGMTFFASGKSRVGLATGVLLVPYIGLASLMIQGGDIAIPAGARATVKLAEDVDFSPSPPTPEAGKP